MGHVLKNEIKTFTFQIKREKTQSKMLIIRVVKSSKKHQPFFRVVISQVFLSLLCSSPVHLSISLSSSTFASSSTFSERTKEK